MLGKQLIAARLAGANYRAVGLIRPPILSQNGTLKKRPTKRFTGLNFESWRAAPQSAAFIASLHERGKRIALR